MRFFEKFLSPSLMKSAESEKSSGGSTPPLKDGEMFLFTDGKTESLQKGDVFENPDGGQMVVERVSGINGEKKVLFTEHSPEGIILNDKRILEKPEKSFHVAAGVKEMEKIDPIKVEYPEFYATYDEQMEHIAAAFAREFATTDAWLERWGESLEEEQLASGNVSQEERTKRDETGMYYNMLCEKIEKINVAWKEIDDRFVEQGIRRIVLFKELRSLEEMMPEDAQEIITELKKEHVTEEPDADLIEEGYRKIVFEKTVKQLNVIAERLQKKYDNAVIGKIAFSDGALSAKEFEKKVNALLFSVTEQSSSEEVAKVLDALDELEKQTFVEGNGYGNGNGRKGRKGKQIKKLRESVDKDKKEAGRQRKTRDSKDTPLAWETIGAETPVILAEGNEKESAEQAVPAGASVPVGSEAPAEQKQVMSEEEIKEAVDDFGYLLLDRAKLVYEKINNLPLDVIPKSIGLYTTIGENKIFLPKDDTNGLLAAYEGLPVEAKAAAEKRWLDMNYDLESEYLGRTFLIALEQTKNDWIQKISTASAEELKSMGRIFEMNRKTGEGGQRKEWRIFIEEKEDILFGDDSEGGKLLKKVLMNAREQRKRAPKDGEHFSFGDIFGKQLRPAIKAANKEIFSLWSSRQRGFSGGDREKKKSGRKRTIEGEKASFELMVPNDAERKRIINVFDGFLTGSIAAVEKGLDEQGTSLVALFQNDPKNATAIFDHVGKRVVEIAEKFVGEISSDDKSALRNAVVSEGRSRLSQMLKTRISGLLEAPKE